jgi:flavin reductase (DIM6/NTAB) family NADH-FMN oxidoreductase RutF
MRKRHSPRGTSLVSISPALVTYRSAAGVPQVVAATWVGIVCATPPLLTVALTQAANRSLDISPGEAFAVNLTAEGTHLSSSFPESLEWSEAEPALAGDELSGVPLIAQCPVQIVCRRGMLHASYGRELLRGEVAAVSLEGTRHIVNRAADLRRLSLLSNGQRLPQPALKGGRPGGHA